VPLASKKSRPTTIPVIDLFAGPGGLGEGFSSFNGPRGERFRIGLSIEKDPIAHQTLMLRAFLRQFDRPPRAYFARLRGEITTAQLLAQFPIQAAHAAGEAVCIELGPKTREVTDEMVTAALSPMPKRWVLIGGPPCQAYSLVGRSRMKGANPDAYERDGRHFLYREYLRILSKFRPPLFVMENVKGILSSTVGGRFIFNDILRDLRGCGYDIHSFVRLGDEGKEPDPYHYVIRAEEYDVPQCRHRVILLGIRRGLGRGRALLRPQISQVPIEQAIGDLPTIRSDLSRQGSHINGYSWEIAVRKAESIPVPSDVSIHLKRKLRERSPTSSGSEFIPRLVDRAGASLWLRRHGSWYLDSGVNGVIHHVARSHMESDLHRYLFAACYGQVRKRSPDISDFPKRLWPHHRNIKAAAKGSMFSDRFRVQIEGRPATTIVSHISKDGHYFIHYDPAQCRSLTVREAARIQTFPDNYFFEGPRTSQYQQVGNAVPPLLARQLADVVHEILKQI
jgi:DNA (cytosine-5)-methyltransferase 1